MHAPSFPCPPPFPTSPFYKIVVCCIYIHIFKRILSLLMPTGNPASEFCVSFKMLSLLEPSCVCQKKKKTEVFFREVLNNLISGFVLLLSFVLILVTVRNILLFVLCGSVFNTFLIRSNTTDSLQQWLGAKKNMLCKNKRIINYHF